MKYLIVVLVCIGCTKFEVKQAVNNVAWEFQPFVHAWIINYDGDWPPGLKIQFGEPVQKDIHFSIGQCKEERVDGKDFQDTVLVRKDQWEIDGIYQQEALIMHEMGHCLKGLDHINETVTITITDGEGNEMDYECPVSWMTDTLQSNELYAICRDFLYVEMFELEEVSDINYPNYQKTREPAVAALSMWEVFLHRFKSLLNRLLDGVLFFNQ